MSYFSEIQKAMTWLGSQPDTVFIGQQVWYPGNALFKTLEGVPEEKKIEFPVAEDMQMGVSIGMALMGKTVISIFPRMDFLLLAMNQLVNHLDKNLYPLKGKVIIRTCIGSTKPLHPGVQHCGDYTEMLRQCLSWVNFFKLTEPKQIMREYSLAYKSKATILIEEADLYGQV